MPDRRELDEKHNNSVVNLLSFIFHTENYSGTIDGRRRAYEWCLWCLFTKIIEMQFTSRSRQKLVICRPLLYAVHICLVSIVFLRAFFRIIVVPGRGRL